MIYMNSINCFAFWYFFISCVASYDVCGLVEIISKSLIMCQDKDAKKSPELKLEDRIYSHDLKSCRTKLSIVLEFRNTKIPHPSMQQYVLIDDFHDTLSQGTSYLGTPIVIRVKESPHSLAYPLRQLFKVNNYAKEDIYTKANTVQYPGCNEKKMEDTMCQSDHSNPYEFQKKISAIKGFCCSCDGLGAGQQKRGGQNCPYMKDDSVHKPYHASTHCLKFDPLWYSVNSVGKPIIRHNVEVSVYVGKMMRESQSRVWDIMPTRDGSNHFIVGTDQTGYSDNEALFARYTETSKPPTDVIIDSVNNFVLTPEGAGLKAFMSKVGYGSQHLYLVVNKSMVDGTGKTCNKIGVSYEAFVNQEIQCQRKAQSCLGNQPHHLLMEDREAIRQGRKGKYRLDNLGKIENEGVERSMYDSNLSYVNFVYESEHVSRLQIEINAQYLDIARPIAQAVIAEMNSIGEGKMSMIRFAVQNTAIVNIDYEIKVVDCTSPLIADTLIKKQISAHQTEWFDIEVKSSAMMNSKSKYWCTVDILYGQGLLIASRKVRISAWNRCICLMYCKCRCDEDVATQCEIMPTDEFREAGFSGIPRKYSLIKKASEMSGEEILIADLFFCCFAFCLCCGLLKSICGIWSIPCGEMCLCMFWDWPLTRYYEESIRDETVVYQSDGFPIHPVNGQEVMQMSLFSQVVCNLCIVLYMPCALCHYLCCAEFDTPDFSDKGTTVQMKEDGHHVTLLPWKQRENSFIFEPQKMQIDRASEMSSRKSSGSFLSKCRSYKNKVFDQGT